MDDTGRALPVNPAPHTDGGGNVAARLRGGSLTGFVISKERLPGVGEAYRFTAHYATCTEQRPKTAARAGAAAGAVLTPRARGHRVEVHQQHERQA